MSIFLNEGVEIAKIFIKDCIMLSVSSGHIGHFTTFSSELLETKLFISHDCVDVMKSYHCLYPPHLQLISHFDTQPQFQDFY